MNRPIIGLLLCGVVTTGAMAADGAAEIDPPKVRQLVRQLEDRQRETRDHAENQLRELGPGVLSLLPEIDARTSGELKQRLLRIREYLEKQQLAESAEGTRFSLQGTMSLSEALTSIDEQTGNKIVDYRARFNQQAIDTEIQVDLDDVLFWKGLDQVLDEAGLTINNFVGDARMLAVVAKPDGALPRAGRAAYEGLFRVEATNLFAERDLRNPDASSLRLGLEIIWEPRVRPILIQHDLDDVSIETDGGQTLGLTTTGTIQLPVQPGVAAVDIRLPLELPGREVKEIASLRGEFVALVPGGSVEFEFTDLAGARNVQRRRGGLTVILDGVRRNGGVQQISVRLRFDQASESLQSHLDWVANNEAILIDTSGNRVDEPNYEKYLERENEVGFSYLFPTSDDLTDYTFIYRTPAGISEVPVDYEIKNIMLP